MREHFFDWYSSRFGKEANLTDGHTFMLFEAFRAGYELKCDKVQNMVVHSPIQVRQTPETAKELGRRLREMSDRPPQPMDSGPDRKSADDLFPPSGVRHRQPFEPRDRDHQ